MRPGAAPVVLASTFHDPEGALVGDIRRFLPALRRRYAAIRVASSPPTAASVRRALDRAGVDAGTPRSNLRGPLYRRCLRAALECAPARVHYLDFDRALHWMRSAPQEIDALLRRVAAEELVLVGRTERAHRSHQRALFATEAIVNRLLATRLGYEGRVDFLAPSFVATTEHTALLLRRSRALGAGIYGEWAALVATMGVAPGYVECRGLDWETPDRARRAVQRIGLVAWRAQYDTPREWALRRQLAHEIVRGFERALGSRVSSGPLHRLRPLPVRASRR